VKSPQTARVQRMSGIGVLWIVSNVIQRYASKHNDPDINTPPCHGLEGPSSIPVTAVSKKTRIPMTPIAKPAWAIVCWEESRVYTVSLPSES